MFPIWVVFKTEATGEEDGRVELKVLFIVRFVSPGIPFPEEYDDALETFLRTRPGWAGADIELVIGVSLKSEAHAHRTTRATLSLRNPLIGIRISFLKFSVNNVSNHV